MANATLLVSIACVAIVTAQHPIGSTCDVTSQQRISTCSRELRTLGIFTQNTGQVDALTINDLPRTSLDYFQQICKAYKRFNQCLGGSIIKKACYPQEPIKARFAVADAALEYTCGKGYNAMIANWDCYLRVATRADVIICERRISQDSIQTGSNTCNTFRSYVDCIKGPIESTCGSQAWAAVLMAIDRPVHVYLPYCKLADAAQFPSFEALDGQPPCDQPPCTLAGAAQVPSLITVVAMLIAALFAKTF